MLSPSTTSPSVATTTTNAASTYKATALPAPALVALAMNIPNISYDPVSVITPTKSIGSAVIHIYCGFRILISTVVPMQSARVPNNWFAAPNIGQMVDMLPLAIRPAHPPTTIPLAMNTPG